MAMTYEELGNAIKEMTDEQRQMNVTVYVAGDTEFYPLVGDYPLVFSDADGTDVLDANHPYLVI